MNWDTYKTLTPELKEEYKFRFHDNKKIRTYNPNDLIIYGGFVIFGLIILILSNGLLYTSTVLQEARFDILRTSMNDLMQSTVFSVKYILWGALVLIIINGILDLKNIISEYWWRKKNHIKTINWWKFW